VNVLLEKVEKTDNPYKTTNIPKKAPSSIISLLHFLKRPEFWWLFLEGSISFPRSKSCKSNQQMQSGK
jgi:hypothetical protein